MADITQENNPDNPTEHQTENPSSEITPTTKPETTNPNDEIKIMEVHHHAHDPSAPHHKKNWKNYFWEFLMLFLAVLCGFLAEYQLEHKIEKDREIQYVESMIADMKDDAIKIQASIAFGTTQAAAFDSLQKTIYNFSNTDSCIRVLYYFQRKYTSIRMPVSFNKRTISQLKNSGGLRLIRNKAASDSIIYYAEMVENAEGQSEYFANYRMGKVQDLNLQIFDNKYIDNYDRLTISEILKETKPILLLNNDDKLLKQYANTLYYSEGSLQTYIGMLKGIENRIPKIIAFLENEYHLE